MSKSSSMEHILAERATPLKEGGCGSHVGESLKVIAIRAGNRRVLQRHIGPALVKVGDAVLPSNFGTKTRLYFPGLQSPPVDRPEPFMPLYFVTSLRPTAQAFTGVL
nr:hypothetical protein Itr_chr04CG08690 [Ipomoea trifida]